MYGNHPMIFLFGDGVTTAEFAGLLIIGSVTRFIAILWEAGGAQRIKVKFWLACANAAPITDLRAYATAKTYQVVGILG